MTPGEVDDLTGVLEIAAGRHPTAAAIEEGRASFQAERTFGAFDRDRIVGGTASVAREITVPGGAVLTAAKITLTGLLPGYRGTGTGSALMRYQLADLRARGEPLAILTTAQSGVPGRHGFGIADLAMGAQWRPAAQRRPAVPRRPAAPAPLAPAPDMEVLAAGPTVRLVGEDEARRILPGLFDDHRRGQPGQVSRPQGFWASWFADQPMLRTGGGERFIVLAEDGDGTPGGYLTYRLGSGPLREQPVSELIIEDLITVTDAARRALLEFCCGFDQAALVSAWNLPADEPLAWLIPDSRSLRITALRPFLRLRLVDIATALAARRYAVTGSIVLDVTDPVLAAGADRYLLCGGPDGAECVPADRTAELAVPVAELAAAYLGGITFTALARAGRVTELVPGAVNRADMMFGWRPAPWTVTDW